MNHQKAYTDKNMTLAFAIGSILGGIAIGITAHAAAPEPAEPVTITETVVVDKPVLVHHTEYVEVEVPVVETVTETVTHTHTEYVEVEVPASGPLEHGRTCDADHEVVVLLEDANGRGNEVPHACLDRDRVVLP